jgi:7-carboxy-7-deazaguanine synthase
MARIAQLRINEIFHSVQGEGTRAGQPCVFIRLTGCHLRCAYCDTPYAFHEGGWMTLDRILRRTRSFACPFVEITGGEPLLQPNVYTLMARLLVEFETVALETSGARSIAKVDPRVVRIVDFKAPSSGEVARNDWSNVDELTANDEVKFVIGSREDYEWSREVTGRYDLSRRCPVLYSPVIVGDRSSVLSPDCQELAPADLAAWILEDALPVRLSLQVHKFIWSPETRGV